MASDVEPVHPRQPFLLSKGSDSLQSFSSGSQSALHHPLITPGSTCSLGTVGNRSSTKQHALGNSHPASSLVWLLQDVILTAHAQTSNVDQACPRAWHYSGLMREQRKTQLDFCPRSNMALSSNYIRTCKQSFTMNARKNHNL